MTVMGHPKDFSRLFQCYWHHRPSSPPSPKPWLSTFNQPMEILDFTSSQNRQVPLSFTKEDLVILGTPVIAGVSPTCRCLICPLQREATPYPSPWWFSATATTMMLSLELRDIL